MSVEGNKTEASYRKIMMDSSSSLKDFSINRKSYYKKYILNEYVEEKDNTAINTGKVVETLLLEPELFDGKFYISACANTPSGLMGDFVEALCTLSRDNVNEHGESKRSFEEISKEAYSIAGFKITYAAVINKFIGSDAEIYYDEIRRVRENNLIIITANELANAEKIVEELKTNPITSDIVNLKSNERYDVIKQMQIEGYEIDNHIFKSMIDLVIADNEAKLIKIYDLKCTWNVEDFYTNYYLYRRSYIQAFLYSMAIVSLAQNKESKYFGYKVSPTAFIVCDSINYYSPLIYTLSPADLEESYLGFTHKEKYYPGVKEIIEELNWAMDNSIWNISMANYKKKGVLNIKD